MTMQQDDNDNGQKPHDDSSAECGTFCEVEEDDVIGLMRSEKTSVMSTAKCSGTHLWQIKW